MKSWEYALPYFTAKELSCNHCFCLKLDLIFAAALVSLRYTWDSPLAVNSLCRCPKYNEDIGGHPNSLHLTENPVHATEGAAAVDINWATWPKEIRLKFARLAWSLGWSLGLAQTYVHLDARSFLPGLKLPRKIYHYDNWGFIFSDVDIKEESK